MPLAKQGENLQYVLILAVFPNEIISADRPFKILVASMKVLDMLIPKPHLRLLKLPALLRMGDSRFG